MNNPQNVLLVCVKNTGQNQMTGAFLKKYCNSKFNAINNRTILVSKINPLVVEVMNEIGIDMSNSFPNVLSEQMLEISFMSINMRYMGKEFCSFIFTTDVVDWNIFDPKEKSITQVQNIHNQIKNKVTALIDSLGSS